MKNEKGFTLIEVLVSLVLLGIIGAAFLGSLGTASNAIFVADEQATAESLARSQMEYVKNQDYIDYSIEGHEEYEKITPSAGYDVYIAVDLLDPENDGLDDDDGIQKIIVTINHGKEVITLVDYKVDR